MNTLMCLATCVSGLDLQEEKRHSCSLPHFMLGSCWVRSSMDVVSYDGRCCLWGSEA